MLTAIFPILFKSRFIANLFKINFKVVLAPVTFFLAFPMAIHALSKSAVADPKELKNPCFTHDTINQ